ncbi:MAG TPA: hypothetical protein VF136_12430 [Methylomirabilota bacterium]
MRIGEAGNLTVLKKAEWNVRHHRRWIIARQCPRGGDDGDTSHGAALMTSSMT